MQLPLSERPPTPRKKTRLVRIGDTEMEMDAPRLVEGHKRDQHKLELYDERMFKGAPWWPGWRITQDQRARVRRAERDILLALCVQAPQPTAAALPSLTTHVRSVQVHVRDPGQGGDEGQGDAAAAQGEDVRLAVASMRKINLFEATLKCCCCWRMAR